MTLVSPPYPVTVSLNAQPQLRPMDELLEESVLLRVRLDGAEISVVAGAFGAVGAQELKPALSATNRPVERMGVRIFFSIAQKCKMNGQDYSFHSAVCLNEQP